MTWTRPATCQTLLCLLSLCALTSLAPARAEEPAPTPAPETVKAPAQAPQSACAEAEVSAAAAALTEDERRVLVGLSIGEDREREEQDVWGGAGDAPWIVGRFHDASCFEVLIASCGEKFSPCFGPYYTFRIKDQKLQSFSQISEPLNEEKSLLTNPKQAVDFNHDGQHEILGSEWIIDTSLESSDLVFSELYQVKDGKYVTLWSSYDGDKLEAAQISAEDVSFKDTNGDGVDELIVTKDGKEVVFSFDGKQFKENTK
jgi:hypothetical protein